MDAAALSRVSKTDSVEGDTGCQRLITYHGCVLDDWRCGIENLIEAVGCRHADHPLMEYRSQIAHGPKNLYPEHENNKQAGQFHRTGVDAVGADAEGSRCANCDRAIGDAAGQRVGGQYPHCAAKEFMGTVGE